MASRQTFFGARGHQPWNYSGGFRPSNPPPGSGQDCATSISTVAMLSGSIPPLTPETFLSVQRT